MTAVLGTSRSVQLLVISVTDYIHSYSDSIRLCAFKISPFMKIVIDSQFTSNYARQRHSYHGT